MLSPILPLLLYTFLRHLATDPMSILECCSYAVLHNLLAIHCTIQTLAIYCI